MSSISSFLALLLCLLRPTSLSPESFASSTAQTPLANLRWKIKHQTLHRPVSSSVSLVLRCDCFANTPTRPRTTIRANLRLSATRPRTLANAKDTYLILFRVLRPLRDLHDSFSSLPSSSSVSTSYLDTSTPMPTCSTSSNRAETCSTRHSTRRRHPQSPRLSIYFPTGSRRMRLQVPC